MQITTAGMIYIPILLISAIFKDYKFNLKLLIVLSALTTVAVVKLGNNDILVYHVSFVIVLLKYLRERHWKIKGENNFLKAFVVYAALTIPFSILFKGVKVVSVDGVHIGARFSFQQITQYLYLLIAYFTYVIVKNSIRENHVSIKEIENTISYAFIIVIIIGFLQKILPLSFINTFFRNSSHTIYNSMGDRISSTFLEPSMLALFATPILVAWIYSLFKQGGGNLMSWILLFAGIILMIMSESSSFIIGIFAGVLIWIFDILNNRETKIQKKLMIVIMLIFFICIITVIEFRENISNNLELFIMKIEVNKDSQSGMERMDRFITSLSAFFKSYLLGVGWGSLRSTDLFSTLLAEVGLVGNILLHSYILKSFHKLLKIGTGEAKKLFMLQAVSLVILMVSVSEFYYFFIWIYWAMGDSLAKHDKESYEEMKTLQIKHATQE